MSYDLNGLQLTPAADTMNTYRLTAVNLREQKFSAYAASRPSHKDEWSMHRIGLYSDPRDAAFVAQEFEKCYNKDQVRVLVKDGIFNEVAKEFRENLEIPEWQYPAEGLTIEEMLGGSYTRNYVDNARDALVEVIKVSGAKAPPLAQTKTLMARVEELVRGGITYRMAARQVIGA